MIRDSAASIVVNPRQLCIAFVLQCWVMSKYIGYQWRNFVPYLCQLVFAAILYVELWDMFVTVVALKYALLVSQWSYGHFLKLITDSILFE